MLPKITFINNSLSVNSAWRILDCVMLYNSHMLISKLLRITSARESTRNEVGKTLCSELFCGKGEFAVIDTRHAFGH